MMSLRQRLNRGLVSILCIIFVLHWLAADWVIRAVTEKQMATRLLEDAESLRDRLVNDTHNQVVFNNTSIGSVYNRTFSGHYYVVQLDDTLFYSKSLGNYALPTIALMPGQILLHHIDNGPQHQPLLILSQSVENFEHKIRISVAQDLSAVDHDITAIRIAYLGFTLIILCCAIVLQSYAVQRALRPLKTVRQALEAITQGQQQQINIEVPTEIKPLVQEINHLLLMVVRRLQLSRTAIGNLAHALKAPLAMLFNLAEHPLFQAHPELRSTLTHQTETVHRCIERELKRARIAGNQQTLAVFNPAIELATLVKLLNTIYGAKALDIKVNAPDVVLPLDREDMLELIGNLLDNACKWARQQVHLHINSTSHFNLSVADDGPGCSTEDATLLTQRGKRLDESIQGHGLGLAIVQDITAVYGGTLYFGCSALLGGFEVKITLPLVKT